MKKQKLTLIGLCAILLVAQGCVAAFYAKQKPDGSITKFGVTTKTDVNFNIHTPPPEGTNK